MQGTHTPAANGICCNIKIETESDRLRSVDDFQERRAFPDSPDGTLEEARPDKTIAFDNGRYPWRVALGRYRRLKAQMRPEMTGYAPQLFRSFHHEAAALASIDQGLDLTFESGDLVRCERHLFLTLWSPTVGTIERFRRYVRRKKRDGRQPEPAGRFYRRPQMGVVQSLHGGARRNRELGFPLMERLDSSGQQIEGSRHASNRIVYFGVAIERHDDIVQALDDLVRIAPQQKARTEERGANVPRAQKPAESEQVGVH